MMDQSFNEYFLCLGLTMSVSNILRDGLINRLNYIFNELIKKRFIQLYYYY